MKNRNNIVIIPLVVAFIVFAQTQSYATDVSVNDSAFLKEVEFTQIDSGKEQAYYKILVNPKSKVIKFKLRIRDEDFGKTPPEISIVFFDHNNTQILIPSSSSQREIKDDKYSLDTCFQYSNKSKTADFNVEITLLSPVFDEVSVSCVMLGKTYKVCDFVELGFDFSPPTKPTTTKATTTEKPEKTTATKTTTSKSPMEKTATIKSTTSKNPIEKTTTEKQQKEPNKTATKQDTAESTVSDQNVDSENGDDNILEDSEGQQLEVTKLEKPSMNSKTKTSLALSGGIGSVAIITAILALLANNRMRKNQVSSIDETETDNEQ